MMSRAVAGACLAGLLSALAPAVLARGTPAGWIEVRTPHFRVLSNGKEKQARRAGLQLEQIRAAVERSLPALRPQVEDGLVVLALKDEPSMRALVTGPQARRLPELPAGVFLEARERACLLLRLDQDDDTFHPAYHEYLHALLARNLPRLPLWLAEGLAEFYSNALFDAHGVRLGGQGWQAGYLHGRFLLPLEALRAVVPGSPIYHDPVRAQLFYAESWALVHYLVLAPGQGEGRRLNQYLALLREGGDESRAFQQIFGPLPQVQKELGDYLRLLAPPVLHLDRLPAWDERAFDLRPLPSEEWAALAGTLQLPEHFAPSALASRRP